MRIYAIEKMKRTAKNRDDRALPDADTLAAYVESLKLHAKESKLPLKLNNAIDALPSPSKIKRDLSEQESKILYETVGWAWHQITGKNIEDEIKVQKAPERLMGNYWMLKNGMLMEGINHFTIIKQNMTLFAVILGIDPFVLEAESCSNPDKMIQTAIANGAVRVFINKNKDAYFQMTDSTYGDWARNRIKKLDFTNKTIKIVDLKQPYCGWESGIVVRI